MAKKRYTFENREIASMAGAKGSRKGVQNKATAEVRRAFQLLVEDNLDRMQSDLDSLKPKERLEIILQLSKFVIPQLQAVGIDDLRDKKDLIPTIIEIRSYKGADPNTAPDEAGRIGRIGRPDEANETNETGRIGNDTNK